MIRTVPTQKLQHASRVAARYRLCEILLQSCTLERRKLLAELVEEDFRVRHEDSCSWELLDGDARLVCRVAFSVLAGRETESKSVTGTLFQVRGTFLLHYERMVEEKLEPADFTAFAELNAIYNAWPYIREFVDSATIRMKLPGFTLEPLMIVPETPKVAEDQ